MNIDQFRLRTDRLVSKHEYDDETVIAVDFGAADDDVSVDAVGDTIIVVAADEQYELDLPTIDSEPNTFIKNGVLTIEVEANE